MSLQTTAVSVTTTAVKALSSGGHPGSTLIYNPGPDDIYVGGPSVTTANGLTIPADRHVGADVFGDEVWVVKSGSAQEIRTLRRA